MSLLKQDSQSSAMRDYGSFKDSLSAPIHRWFTYPAGYSYKLVHTVMKQAGIEPNQEYRIADPFVGSGTTSVAARDMGVDSVGVEAHPFMHWVAQTKMRNYDADRLAMTMDHILADISRQNVDGVDLDGVWPDLIYRCFGVDNLKILYIIREVVAALIQPQRDFFMLALAATLRRASCAGTGWPYVAPSKYAGKKVERDALTEFKRQCIDMIGDVGQVSRSDSRHDIVLGDAREFASHVPGMVDLVVTSPPYLNNYDYADRTRLETYFLGIYKNWGEITTCVRDHLITSATTQVRLRDFVKKSHMPILEQVSRTIHREMQQVTDTLGMIRNTKPGKKRYDMMVAGYFEDMTRTISEVYETLDRGRMFVLVLGDSAPYGVHIPTDILMGRIAKAVGFSQYKIDVLRRRGEKWKANPQRHHVKLRESVVVITK